MSETADLPQTTDNQLTEEEAELYDRQIRLWGLESQKRLRASRILISGVNGLGAEIAKNIILAGVKSVKFQDHRQVTEIESTAQFFIPPDSIGQNRAEASLERAKVLNPMVDITADVEPILEKPEEYFEQFDVVFVTELKTDEIIKINNICRSKNVKFFAGDLWGMFGYSFTDLQTHEFVEDIVKHKIISKPGEKTKTELVTTTVHRTLEFQPFEKVVKFDFTTPEYAKRIKRVGAGFVLMRIFQTFRDNFNRDPFYKSRDDDILELVKIRDDIGKGMIQDEAFHNVFAQISPVAAIIGGEIAQEIIKTVSKKEAPHLNVFIFDPDTCCGFIESII